MKVAFTSDLHVDTSDINRRLFDEMILHIRTITPDYFLVAGDISARWSLFCECADALHSLVKTGCNVCVVLGNHDIWLDDSWPTSVGTSWGKLAACCKALRARRIIPLDLDGPLIDEEHNLAITGTIGWYDYSFRSPNIDMSIEDYAYKTYMGARWNDVEYANWEEDDPTVCAHFLKELDRQLQTSDKVKRVIVVTHHVPFQNGVIVKGDPMWDFFNAYMGAGVLGDTILKHLNVQRTIFGHTHFPTHFIQGHVTCQSSPVGYLYDNDQLGQENSGRSLTEVAKRKITEFSM